MPAIHQLLLELGESVLLSTVEPYPLQFRAEYDDEIGRVIAAIRRAGPKDLARLRWQVNRNPFLFGCLDFTTPQDHEQLIVGYGFRHGSTTRIDSIHRVVGSEKSVGIPVAVGQAMHEFYEAHEQNEIILFHNHPLTAWRLLLDNLPLPSGDDREMVEIRSVNPSQLLRMLLNGGRVFFYIGENRRVKRFHLPSFIRFFQKNRTILPVH